MKVKEIIDRIEARLPVAWGENWDNTGLIVGDPESSAERIAVSLDATENSVSSALEKGCRMLVVHHPAIFTPLKQIVLPAPEAKMIKSALTGGVAVYSAHTNWDSSPEGVNVILSQSLGLSGVIPIMPPHDGEWGMGAIGSLPAPMTVSELAERTKEAWGLSFLLTYGDDSTPLSRVALCGGAGGNLLSAAVKMGADVFISADINYHYLLRAQLMKTHLIAANHDEMERASLPNLCRLISEAVSLEVLLLEKENWTPIVI
jgi:dinuclear metal center YbgI/SA1388 family protein